MPKKRGEWVEISEAAEFLGVKMNTIRNWVKRGKIQGQKKHHSPNRDWGLLYVRLGDRPVGSVLKGDRIYDAKHGKRGVVTHTNGRRVEYKSGGEYYASTTTLIDKLKNKELNFG